MENKNTLFEPLIERAEAYGKTTIELFKLKATEKIAVIISGLVSRTIAIFVISIFVIVANIGVALWLGDVLGKSYYGFFCVAGFYGVLGVIIYFFMHNVIKKRVGNSIISQILN